MDLKGVEIFAVGRWNDRSFTEADLDAMAASFAELKLAGRVPLKFGHNDEQPLTDGQPALGWVQRVYRDGKVLLADFTSMPRVVHDAIRDGRWKFVSVELLRDVVFQGGEFPWVLSGVALLGADIPAVSGLKDLQALAMSRRAEFRSGARLTFTREVKSTGDDDNMSDEKDKPDLGKIMKQVEELSQKVATFTARNATLEAENERLKAEAKAKDEAAKKERVTVHRKAIGERFAKAIKEKRIYARVQEMFEKDPAFKSDDAVVELTLDFVDGYIKDHTVQGWKAPAAGGDDDGGHDALGGSALPGVTDEKAPFDVQMDQVVQHYMSKDQRFVGKSYAFTLQHALKAHPELADKYRFMPGTKD